jgi:hypothetical protein
MNEPCPLSVVASKIDRLVSGANAADISRFETIRILPELVEIFPGRNLTRAWAIAREGLQSLIYDHVMDWYRIGWKLTDGRVYCISKYVVMSLEELFRDWPVGPIALGGGIDIMRGSPLTKNWQLEIVAYGPLDDSDSTKSLLTKKIDSYLEQLHYSDKVRDGTTKIILACDEPPDPKLDQFISAIKKRVVENGASFVIQ